MKAKKKQVKTSVSGRLVLVAVSILLALVFGYFTYMYHVSQNIQSNRTGSLSADEIKLREDRLNKLFENLKLDNSYSLVDEKVSGERDLYPFDHTRSHSSIKIYEKATNVDETVSNLKDKVLDSGFILTGQVRLEPKSYTYYFKSTNDEYLRFMVENKTNYSINGIKYGRANDNVNTGPSRVTIGINLDDNNL